MSEMPRFTQVLVRFRNPLIYTVICAVFLLAMSNRAWQHVSVINGGEWNPIQSFVRENRQGDEPICFLPSWTIGHATDLYKFRGIDLLKTPSEAWEDQDEPLSGFWVVSLFDVFDPSSIPQNLYPHREHRLVGGADVYLFRRQPITLPDGLVFHIDEARCSIYGMQSSRLDLEWYRVGFAIPRSVPGHRRLNHLGCRMTSDRFGGKNHRGIWFHPPPPGQSLEIEWSGVDLKRWLAVSGGLRDAIAGRRSPPVHLSVSLDGKVLNTFDFPSKRGWRTFAQDFGQGENRKGRIAFKVWTKNSHSRHFVFDAQFQDSRPDVTKESNRSKSRSKARAARNQKNLSKAKQKNVEGGTKAEDHTTKGKASPTDPAL